MTGFWTTETMTQRLPQLITPYNDARVRNCSYELGLGSQVFVTGDDKAKRVIEPGTQIVIPPGQFANLLTEETVRVPNDAIGLISMKFTLKQPGLVNVSGFHVDPGYEGKLLFSVYNAGPQSVPITSGTPAFLLWYCSLDQVTANLYDKPARENVTDADVKHLVGAVSSPQELARRVEKLEDRLRIGAWVIGAVATAAISIGVGRALLDDGGGKSTTNSTTTTVSPSTSTTADTGSPTPTTVP
jgi:dCTP deaminase